MSGLALRVRTRSKVHDYRFIGSCQPVDRWWEEQYGSWTDFSRPTILVEPGRFFVSGIRSARTDSKGARIHYALLCQVEADGLSLAAKALSWLCAILAETNSLELAGICLDKLGDEAWSAAVQGASGADDTINAGLVRLLEQCPDLPNDGLFPQPFVLPVQNQEAFKKLAHMAAEVIGLEPGQKECAVYLNLASSSELRRLSNHRRSAIVCREVDTAPKRVRPLLAGATITVLLGIIVAAVILFNLGR